MADDSPRKEDGTFAKGAGWSSEEARAAAMRSHAPGVRRLSKGDREEQAAPDDPLESVRATEEQRRLVYAKLHMTLLYFAPVPWDSYAQRAHYFVRHFLRASGRSVIWIDPYPLRLPVWRDLGRLGASAWTTPRPVNFTVISLSAAPTS